MLRTYYYANLFFYIIAHRPHRFINIWLFFTSPVVTVRNNILFLRLSLYVPLHEFSIYILREVADESKRLQMRI